jgi:hypothetical protein
VLTQGLEAFNETQDFFLEAERRFPTPIPTPVPRSSADTPHPPEQSRPKIHQTTSITVLLFPLFTLANVIKVILPSQ